jgi:Secretion system C-terminal sorting domain
MKAVAFIKLLFLTLFLFLTPSQKTAGQSISGIINTYYKVNAVNSATSMLTLTSTAGLSPGIKVLIIQMKGAIIDNTNTVAFGNITNLNNAGNYEFNTICSITGNDVLMKYNFAKSYTASGSVQLIPVPQYNTVTVTDTLRPAAWNSATGTGGVLVLEANTINLNSAIDARGKGFVGGGLQNYPTPTYDCTIAVPNSYYFIGLPASGNSSAGPKGEGIADFITNAGYGRGKQANGGGGGNNHNSGGGGGSNYGTGGQGAIRSNVPFPNCTGPSVGLGGLTLSLRGYSPDSNRLYMGGGGGAGHENNNVGTPGGPGGGIVILTAITLNAATTSILADGLPGMNPANVIDPFSSGGDGAGGGGAGGAIVLDVIQVNGTLLASVKGAKGSDGGRTGATGDCPGRGGGGGGGAIWMKGAVDFPNVADSIAGGASGVGAPLSTTNNCQGQAGGATPGTVGAALTGYNPVTASILTCVPLPVKELRSFTGKTIQQDVLLQWNMNVIDEIAVYELQRSDNQVTYTSIYNRRNNGAYSFNYTDAMPFTGTVFYRLKITRTNGSSDYSSVIKISKTTNSVLQWLTLHPNPASQQLSIPVLAQKNSMVNLQVYTAAGQPVLSQSGKLSAGYSTLQLPVHQLPAGVYWLVAEAEGVKSIQRFVKQ